MRGGRGGGGIAGSRPAPDAAVNRGHLCVKGRYAFSFLRARDRVTTPLIRRGRRWVRATWPEAIRAAAAGLARARERHGPNATGIL